MVKHLRVPDADTSRRLLTNLRRTRVEMESFNLKIAEVIAQLELEAVKNRQKRMEDRNRLNAPSQV
ncbi:MAG: hypothetical protein WCO45_18225 [Pseudanabaena sp. ELA607]|jgi:DNA-binding protein H-NS